MIAGPASVSILCLKIDHTQLVGPFHRSNNMQGHFDFSSEPTVICSRTKEMPSLHSYVLQYL